MRATNMPVIAHANREPPDPEAYPALYDGVVWRRVLGYAIDVAIIAVFIAIAWIVFPILWAISFGLLTPLLVVAIALIPVAYHTFFIGGPKSATPGMQVFDIEVWSIDGRRPGYAQAFLVTVAFYVTIALTGWFILLVALFNRRRRCVHDFLCGTVVTRRVPRLDVYLPPPGGQSGS